MPNSDASTSVSATSVPVAGPSKRSIFANRPMVDLFCPKTSGSIPVAVEASGTFLAGASRKGVPKLERWNGKPDVMKQDQPNSLLWEPQLPLAIAVDQNIEQEVAVAEPDDERWDRFFHNQTIESLLQCCLYADAVDLENIHLVIMNKLGIDINPPHYPEFMMRLYAPPSFPDILESLARRILVEVDDRSRFALMLIAWDITVCYAEDLIPWYYLWFGC